MNYTDIEADLIIAQAEIDKLREINIAIKQDNYIAEMNISLLTAEIARLRAELAELREAISRYCHNDCYRDSCEGNEDVGIPDCPLAKYAPKSAEKES